MTRVLSNEISEHDQLVLMMARYFKGLGYSEIKADIPGWTQPAGIFWTSSPDKKYVPDLTCKDSEGNFLILEAETCGTLEDAHTREQFKIFRAHANNSGGRFEVVVPKECSGNNTRLKIIQIAKGWGIVLDNVWTPGS